MRYIGDISRADAELLAQYARGASRILEFGSGASTQVLAQSSSKDAALVSVETDPAWIERTRKNLARLSIRKAVRFVPYKQWKAIRRTETSFGLIFNDGADRFRERFALESWALLEIGGRLLFHDTRRENDLRKVLAVVNEHFLEISSIGLNEAGSNITVITRKAPEPWVDWNVVEGRAKWEYGHAEPPSPLPWEGGD